MALTIEVTKQSVSEQIKGLWNITVNLRCLESAVEVINQDVSVRYKTGDDIDDKRARLLDKMQVIIDEWKNEQAVFDHAKLDALVTYLESNLEG